MPLIKTCRTEDLGGEVWYADDANGGGRFIQLCTWWGNLGGKGPQYGYYSNSGKTWLVVKPEIYESATAVFASTGVQITTKGRRHLGAA